MTTPWLSVIIPTIGRPELGRALASVRQQAPPSEVELLVVGDTHGNDFHDALAPVPAICKRFGARYVGYDDGGHMVGQGQREYGQRIARGQWLWWLQDDDVATEHALAVIREGLHYPGHGPRLFKIRTRWGFVVWQYPQVCEGNIDADCIVTPRDRKRLGRWGRRYCGDFDFIRETVDLWQRQCVWRDAHIAIARPPKAMDWVRGWA